jgi:hypothetical protein
MDLLVLNDPVAALVRHMDRLAFSTWDKIAYGPGRNIPFREDGITSENLFALDLEHPWLNVMAFSTAEESRNGADWEWWIGNADDGWIALRLQAKRLYTSRRYAQLEHRVGESEDLQADLLIDRSIADSTRGTPVIPLYCFYNGWIDSFNSPPPDDAVWPEATLHSTCPSHVPPPNCVHVALRQYGCAVSSALTVRQLIDTPGRPFDYRNFLPQMVPWSHLFVTKPTRDIESVEEGTNVYDSAELVTGTLQNLLQLLSMDDTEPSQSDAGLRVLQSIADGPGDVLPRYVDVVRSRNPAALRELTLSDFPEAKKVAVFETSTSANDDERRSAVLEERDARFHERDRTREP